jgi:DNA-binding transcriptional MerR regulator
VLKSLGLPLEQIGRLLKRESPLPDTLRRQQQVLTEKRRQLDMGIYAIEQAERSARLRGGPDWDLFKTIVREIEMQNSTEWSKKYYSPEAQSKVEDQKKLWNPELQAQVTKQWTELVAARRRTLVEGFTGGDPEIQKGLTRCGQTRRTGRRRSASASPSIRVCRSSLSRR